MVKAAHPFKLHPTSNLYMYKVIEHLQLWWMVTWMHTHTHTITFTIISPDLGGLTETESLGHVSVQRMPLHHG